MKRRKRKKRKTFGTNEIGLIFFFFLGVGFLLAAAAMWWGWGVIPINILMIEIPSA